MLGPYSCCVWVYEVRGFCRCLQAQAEQLLFRLWCGFGNEVVIDVFSVPSRQKRFDDLQGICMLSMMARWSAFDGIHAVDGTQLEPWRFGANINISHGS
jgi:hypothetical protein